MSADPGGLKGVMRLAMTSAVSGLGDGEKARCSEEIVGLVGGSDAWRAAEVVMMYAGDGGEPGVDGLIGLGVSSGKTVCVPGIDWGRKLLLPRAVRSGGDLIGGKHGIRVPGEGCGAVEAERIGLVLVPGVAFDRGGGRLGRGGGFYDRFVAAWRGGCPMGSAGAGGAVALGVCFGVQVVDAVPSEAHDARMDGLVTERGLSMAE